MTRPLLIRTAALPIEALDALHGARAAALADATLEAQRQLDVVATGLEARLFAAAGPREAAASAEGARRRHALLECRRRVHARKPLEPEEDEAYARAFHAAAEANARFERGFDADLRRTRQALVTLGSRPPLPLALRLVGASLHAGVERLRGVPPERWSHGDRHRASKLAAYVVRAATKTSPVGLFCATALARADGARVEAAGSPAIARIDAILSVSEARKGAALLAIDPGIAGAVVPRAEPTLRREGDAWTFWRAATPRDPDDVEVRSRIRGGETVDRVLELAAEGGRTFPELVAEAARRLDADPDDAASFVAELVRVGAIVAEVGIPYAERRPLRFLLERSRAAGVEPTWGGAVDELEACVDAIDLASPPAAIDEVVARLGRLPRVREPAPDETLRVDAASSLDVRIPETWIDEIRRSLRPYVRLFAAMYPERRYREAAASRFLAKFPADTDVPAIDLYHGVFEPVDVSRPTTFPDPGGDSVVSRVRERFVSAALADPDGPLVLDDDLVDAWIGASAQPAWNAGVLFQVVGPDEPRFVLNSLYQGSGLALARFAHLHGPAVVEELRRAHAHLARPGAVVAEITYNHGGRTANAGLRPSIFQHEIELPGETATPGRTGIPLRELHLRWISGERRFVARWEREGVEVVPVINSGVNPTGIVSFLVEIGQQGQQPIGLFPGFDDPRVRVWPRVDSGRLTLMRRRWVFPRSACPSGTDAAFFLDVQRWREREGLPRWIFAATPGDPKPRAFDLESPILADLLQRTLIPSRGEPPVALHVTPMDPGPDDLWLAGPEGRYASEFLVQLEHPGDDA